MITVIPAIELPLEQFLNEHEVRLEIREMGSGRWAAELYPEILYEGPDHGGFCSNSKVSTTVDDYDSVIPVICGRLSGRRLLLRSGRSPVDHRYTRVVPSATEIAQKR